MQSIITRITRYFALICALGLTAGAWGNASLVSYLDFETIGNKGVNVRAGGFVDPVQVENENGYVNYTPPADAKFGAHAYQSKPNGGAIGWRNNDEGLVSVSDGFTISFWFNSNSTDNYRSFFGFGFLNGKNYRFDKSEGNALVVYESAASGDSETVGTQLAVIPYAGSAWNHVAIVCQPGGSSLTVYVNATPKTISPSDISSTSLREVRFCYGRCIDGQDGAIYRSSHGIQLTWFDDAALFSGVLYGSSIGKIAAGAQPISVLMNDSAFLAAPVYKPSININFTNGAVNGLTTGADVGLTGYAVTGTSWNNFVISNNATFNTVNAIDSTGAASAMSGVSVTISGTRGSHNCSELTPASDLRHGYIDDNAGNPTPTVTVTGIPYYKYRVLVYHSTDTASRPFGYDTINGTNYTYENDTLTEGTTAWGDSGVSNSANAIAEGGNVLLTGELSGSTLTVVGHRAGGDVPTARGCIAAIQIIEVKPETTENDLIIDVSGDTTYTVSEAKTLSGTVYLTGNGTLTLDGSAKISAATINLGDLVTLEINADRLDATTFTGSGTVVYNNSLPVTGKGWTESAKWTGTVQIKSASFTGVNGVATYLDVNKYGNTGSILELNNCSGWLPVGNTTGDNVCTVPLKVRGTLTINDGYSRRQFTINKLLGNGAIYTTGNSATVTIQVLNADDFTGYVNLNSKRVIFGETIPETFVSGQIYVGSGFTFTVPNSNAAWYGTGGITLDGELKARALSNFGGGTTITTTDNGVFTLLTNSNADDMNVNYARIKGTGTLKLEGSAYRCISTNNFPTTMTVDNRLTAGFLHRIPNLAITIGSLAGDGYLRSDWSGSAGDRDLKVLQAKDTTWSGKFWTSNPHRFRSLIVAPGATSVGTLTLSATHEVAEGTGLTVESGAKVNLTGTWVGATTVNGSLAFGGANGTKVNGAVTTSSGAVLDFSDFTAGDTAPILGALTLNANTTIKFPAGVTFPYKLATSVDLSSLAADKYTIGGETSTAPLMFANGTAYTEVTGTFSGGEDPIAWNDITWSGATPLPGSEVDVTVSGSGTLTLGTVQGTVQSPVIATKATFNIPENTTLTLNGLLVTSEIVFTGKGKVVCCQGNTLTGKIKGDSTITVEYPEHVLPTMADWTSEDWAGTLVLRNCGREQNVNYPSGERETHGVVRFDRYGSANSVIRAPGYKGISAVADQNTTCSATLFIDANETVEFNHGTGESALNTNGAGFRFAKLAGTGTLRLDGTSDTAQYIFNDVDDFAGTVEITFPAEGGRKSFLFGAEDSWTVMNSAYAANLVILDDMTVAAGKTWDIPAGVIIGADKTLTLGNGATVKALSKDTEGTIAVSSGVATLQGISNAVVNAKLTIGDNATLNITDPSLTTLTIPADSTEGGTYSNAGMLNLSGCTSLTTLHLALGEAKTFDLSKVTLPSTCTTVYYDIGSKRNLDGYELPASSGGVTYYYYATETIEEYANSDSAGFTATNVPDGADVYLIRQNGATLKAAVSGTSRTYTGGRSFAGGACWHEWDFEQSNIADRLNDTGRFFVNSQAGAVTLSTVSSPAESDYTTVQIDVQNENKRVLSSALHPNAAIEFGTSWSAALRCSLPTETGDGKVVAIAFGDTTSGVLGLAAGADGFMELFTWASGTYTVLAQLQVESPSDKDNMHIYVFTVNNGTVSFYRDGEFIHTAAFTSPSSITKFMVGDVPNRGEAQDLPSAVASGGYIDYVRLYDNVLPVADVEGLSVRRPFVSAIDMYERTVGLFQYWSETDAWTWKKGNNGGTATADEPAAAANVTLIANGETDMSLNLASDAAYNTLIFDGNGEVGLHQASVGKLGADMMVVRKGVDLTADYDAVSLANAVVSVDVDASLAFNFSDYPFDDVTAVTTITLAGNVPAVLYDNTCKDCFSVRLPDSLPAHITSAVASWDGASYKITITPNHTAGGSVYYKDGTLAAGMTVYTDAALSTPTKLFAGDTLVISDASSTGDVSVDDTFNGNISVTRAAVNLTSTGTTALAGKTITAAAGCAVSLSGDGFGALTLVGPGLFSVAGDTTAASLTGTVGITVEAGKTLTLGSISSFLTGGVGGTGTVKLPAVSGGNGFVFGPYGDRNGMIALTSFSEYLRVTGSESVNVETALRLDGNMTLTALSNWDYTFAKICGTGDFTVPNRATPKSFTITKLEDYSGTLVNNHASVGITVSKLITNGAYGPGDVLLTKGGSGTVTISSVEVGGLAKQGDWFGNDFCLVAAEYNGTKYKTVADAIDEAGNAHLDAITIYENTETLSEQYMFVTEGNSVKVALKPFAVVNGATTTYHDTAQDAISEVGTLGQVYDYIEVIVGGSVDIPLSICEELKIKNSGAATLNFTGIADDCTTSETALDNGVTKYTKSNKATAYIWTGEAFDSNTGDPDPRWDAKGNWSYVNANGKIEPASRQPQSGDTVAFNSEATVTLGVDTTVDSVTCSAAVVFNKSSSATTLTATTGIVLTDAAASITVSGVTLSPMPTTTVAGSYVKEVNGVYSVKACGFKFLVF